jgi:hypothetical protein
VLDEFDRSKNYFDAAYAFAAKSNFDTFQIDNHYARWLIRNAIRVGDPDQAMDAFNQAHRTVAIQIQSDRRAYPFRVAYEYQRFWGTFRGQLTADQAREVRVAAREVLTRIDALPEHRQAEVSVKRCAQAMRAIAEGS